MKRLFFALWPDDESRRRIDQLNQRIEQPGRKLMPENLHITLVFLGNVDDEIAQAVKKSAANIQGRPIRLEFNELDFWRRPRVLCLTCQRQPADLYKLVNDLKRMVKPFPITLDTRAYRAHITMARKAQRRPEIEFESIVIEADSFVLVESVSTDQGVRYQVLERWPLNLK